MNRLFVMIFVIAGLAIALPPPGHSQEELDEIEEIEESGPRLGEGEARRILAEELSPGASRQQQVEYYQRRERAAFTMGDAAIRLDALRRLVALTEAPDKLSPYIGSLWREEMRYGNLTKALELGEALVRHPAATPLQRLTFSVVLGRDYVTLGDRDRAADVLKKVEAEGKNLRDTRGPHQVAVTAILVEDLRARVLHVQGDPEGAHAAMRRAIEASHAEVERSRAAAGSSRTNREYDGAIRTRNSVMRAAVWLYFKQGRNEEAEGLARLGLRLAVEERTGGATVGYWHGKLAQALLGERRFEEAVAAANEALAGLRASAAAESSLFIVHTQTWLMQALFGLEASGGCRPPRRRDAHCDGRRPEGARAVDNPVLQAFLHLKNGRLAPGARADRRSGAPPPALVRRKKRVHDRGTRGAGPRAPGAGCGTPRPRGLSGRVCVRVRAGEHVR